MQSVYIYGVQFSPFVRAVQMVCEEKGIDYQIGKQINGQTAEFKSEAHLAYHPLGKMPVLFCGDIALTETATICRFLDSQYEGKTLQPNDLIERSKVDEWCQLCTTYLIHAFMRDYILELAFPQGQGGKPRFDVIEMNKASAVNAIKMIEKQLADQDFMLGNRFTLADCVIAPALYYAQQLPEQFALLSEKSPVHTYVARIRERDSGKKVIIPKQ
ncbi:glutathione S-transferase family protein [Neptunicella marina]|uniref:glutathione transferase n=1 Tax=Neptunicella marina TaxID=2125989 RepID=A0A8J6M4E8_9ALTE|nr:glutathione S-transferase family protein [Neptunicella marina]MBC3766056.1 glutathione S-transferase family protein [Neptunicella marina]